MTQNDKCMLKQFKRDFRFKPNLTDKKYFQNIIVLDTETTTAETEILTQKIAFSYKHMFIIDGTYYSFDTQSALIGVLKHICEYQLENRMYKIFVHNLGYDYIFFKNFLTAHGFKNITVFARKTNDFVKINVDDKIEFCDTLALKNCSLDVWAEELNLSKKTGYLDYNKVRTYSTELSEREQEYNYTDVYIMFVGISVLLEKYKLMKNIPITSTGVVRQALRDYLQSIIISNKNGRPFTAFHKMRGIYKNSRPDAELLLSLKIAYCGGITHAGLMYQGVTLDNVGSFDITSSYPYQLVSHKYPHKFTRISIYTTEYVTALIENIDRAAVLFKCTLNNLRPKKHLKPISIISSNNVIDVVGLKGNNNGKIIFADSVTLMMTNVDYHNIKRFYDFDMEIDMNYVWVSVGNEYDYICKYFVDFILKSYGDKTKLKGVSNDDEPNAEQRYLMAKQCVNGLYGMCVQFPLNDIIEYDVTACDERAFKTRPVSDKLPDEIRKMKRKQLFELLSNDDALTALNDILDEIAQPKHRQILLYQHGVWCTAYARYQLCTMISKLHNNFVYCDTDSIKFIYTDKIYNMFETENKNIIEKLKLIAYKTEIKFDDFAPYDKKHKQHIIGLWDFEGISDKFKTLGAKRYLQFKHGELKATVAGCNPDNLADYMTAVDSGLLHKYTTLENIKSYRKTEIDNCNIKRIFDKFTNNFVLPAKFTGKLTHKTYLLPDIYSAPVTDYNGNTENIQFGSFIILEPCTFEMNLFIEYQKLINEREQVYQNII